MKKFLEPTPTDYKNALSKIETRDPDMPLDQIVAWYDFNLQRLNGGFHDAAERILQTIQPTEKAHQTYAAAHYLSLGMTAGWLLACEAWAGLGQPTHDPNKSDSEVRLVPTLDADLMIEQPHARIIYARRFYETFTSTAQDGLNLLGKYVCSAVISKIQTPLFAGNADSELSASNAKDYLSNGVGLVVNNRNRFYKMQIELATQRDALLSSIEGFRN